MQGVVTTGLQEIAAAGRAAHEEMRDTRAIPYELQRTAELTDVLHARLAQLEDRLSSVRSPLELLKAQSDASVPPVSPVADQIRTVGFGLERAIARIDQMLGDVEL